MPEKKRKYLKEHAEAVGIALSGEKPDAIGELLAEP